MVLSSEIIEIVASSSDTKGRSLVQIGQEGNYWAWRGRNEPCIPYPWIHPPLGFSIHVKAQLIPNCPFSHSRSQIIQPIQSIL